MATVVDYSAGVPSASAIEAAGHRGAVRYISPPRPGAESWMHGKPMHRPEVDDLRARGLDVACVWQFGKDKSPDVMRGSAGGRADALAADAHLKAVGLDGWPVFFAVDFDISESQWKSTARAYFEAAVGALGRARVGIYGHRDVCGWARRDRVVADLGQGKSLLWQTRSWRPGIHESAVLYQRIVDTKATPGPVIGGVTCDVNDILHDYWGQSPPQGPGGPAPAKEVVRVAAPIKPNPKHRGDPTFLPALLQAFGVDVVEFEGWKGRGQGDFENIEYVMAHHTAGPTPDQTSPEIIAFGHSALRGLLSQIHLGKNGVATIVGAGIAYHAGLSGSQYMKGYIDRQSFGKPTSFTTGNALSIGIEAQNSGKEPWPQVQMEAYVRTCAAICWYLGHNADRVIGHKEFAPGRKVDPSFDMGEFRKRVQHFIDNPPFETEITGGLFMSLPIERQEDLAAKIDRMHHELTHEFDSRYDLDRLRRGEITPDQVYKDTFMGYLLNADRKQEDMHANMLPAIFSGVKELLVHLVGSVADRVAGKGKGE